MVDSYDSVMKGTKYGPVIVPGDSLSSSLYLLVAGKVHSSIWMPHGRNREGGKLPPSKMDLGRGRQQLIRC